MKSTPSSKTVKQNNFHQPFASLLILFLGNKQLNTDRLALHSLLFLLVCMKNISRISMTASKRHAFTFVIISDCNETTFYNNAATQGCVFIIGLLHFMLPLTILVLSDLHNEDINICRTITTTSLPVFIHQTAIPT